MLFFVKKHVNLKTVNHRDFDFLKFEVDEAKCWNNYYEYVIFFQKLVSIREINSKNVKK